MYYHKRYFIVFAFLLGGVTVIAQQPCPPNNPIITTEPQDLGPLNTSNFKINQFDWTLNPFHVNSPNYDPQQSPFIGSPFYQTNTQLSYLNDGIDSDFQWDDGWELIQRGFGYVMGGDPHNPPSNGSNSVPDNTQNLIAPYLILYNKFEAKLRVFGAIGQTQLGYNSVAVKLRFQNQNQVSALLSNHSSVAQVMSENTSAVEIKALASYPADKYLFFHADFPMAYDPCTCKFDSDIDVKFSLIDNMSVNLYGRFVGTNTTIGSGGGSSGNIDNRFLSALQSDMFDGTDVVAGAITYKNISDLEDQLKEAAEDPKTDPLEHWKNALEILKFGASLAGIYVPELGIDNDYFKKDGRFSKDVKAVGLVSDFFVARIKNASTSSNTNSSKPTMIEGEAIFSGSIVDDDSYGWGAQMAVPGSKSSNNATEHRFPLYNESLGLFAVMNKPEVKHVDLLVNQQMYCGPYGLPTLTHNHQYQFDNLEYVFNPAAEVNETNTYMYGSLEFHSSGKDLGLTKNLFKLRDSVYMTPMLPLECLSDLLIEYGHDGSPSPPCGVYAGHDSVTKAYLKTVIMFEFTRTDAMGIPQRSVQIFKYPISLTSGTATTVIDYPTERDIQASHFTSTNIETFYAWNVVNITGDLTADPGVEVNIYAGDEINVEPGVEIGPGINLQIGLPTSCNNPISPTTLGTFCTDGRYKANVASTRVMNPDYKPNNPGFEMLNLALTSRPNPFDTSTLLEYTLPESIQVDLRVFDLTGKEVMQLVAGEYQEAGDHQIKVSGNSLSPGVYSAILRTPKGSKTVKLVKIK